MNKIIISNLKNIKKMEFYVPQKKGVYIITGNNGCGKTSLLVCLYRIGYNLAFSENFKSTRKTSLIDEYADSTIRYCTDKGEVTFVKRAQRWSPTTKGKKYEILKSFNFSSVSYIRADGDRVEPTRKQLEERKPKKAAKDLIDNMNFILRTNKYNSLVSIKIGQGRSREIYLIKKSKTSFYSEKQFSLGELVTLKIVRDVLNAKENSLFLIDEVEMALHPRAQKNLVEFLKNQAKEKKLTVLISTHSSAIVKSVAKENVIFLQHDSNDNVEVISPCYPSVALQDIEFEDNISPERLFLVEDQNAKYVLDAMINRLYKEMPTLLRARYFIVPIGGYQQVIDFLNNTDDTIFTNTKVTAFLDKDVQDEHADIIDAQPKKSQIKFLPCTPEVGVIRLFSSDLYIRSDEFKNYSGYTVDISDIMESKEYKDFNKTNERDRAKDQLAYIVSKISAKVGKNPDVVRNVIYMYYVEKIDTNDLKVRLCQVLNS